MPEDLKDYLEGLKQVPWWAWLFLAFLLGLLILGELEGPDMASIHWLEMIHGL